MTTIKQLEEQIFHRELIRVVFRAPLDQTAPDYTFKKCLGNNAFMRVLKERIKLILPNTEFVIMDGLGRLQHHDRLQLGVIRGSYALEEKRRKKGPAHPQLEFPFQTSPDSRCEQLQALQNAFKDKK